MDRRRGVSTTGSRAQPDAPPVPRALVVAMASARTTAIVEPRHARLRAPRARWFRTTGAARAIHVSRGFATTRVVVSDRVIPARVMEIAARAVAATATFVI